MVSSQTNENAGDVLFNDSANAGTVNTPADAENYSIEQALQYQKEHNLSLENFITGFANKIKFQVSISFLNFHYKFSIDF